MTMTKVAVPTVLAKPEGNAAAMEAMAKTIRCAGGNLADVCGQATGSLGTMTFTSPTGSRLRGRVRGRAAGQIDFAHDLASFATSLENGAMQLRNDIIAFNKSVTAHNSAVEHNAKVDALPNLPALTL